MIPYLAVLALLVAGLVYATPRHTSSDDWSTIASVVTGGLAVVAGSLYARKRSRARGRDQVRC